jgi:hypothetical protein
MPQVRQVSDDSDGVHNCDHTRGVDRKQLDDGMDYTFVSDGGSMLLSIRLCRTDTKVQWTCTYGVAHPSQGVDVRSHCRGVT